jgi:hypothetical protein
MERSSSLGVWRKYEEAANQCALLLLLTGELFEADALFDSAATSAEQRKDAQMYATLASSRCAVQLALGKHDEVAVSVGALERLEARLADDFGAEPLVISIAAVVAVAQLQIAREIGGALAAARRALSTLRVMHEPSQFGARGGPGRASQPRPADPANPAWRDRAGQARPALRCVAQPTPRAPR